MCGRFQFIGTDHLVDQPGFHQLVGAEKFTGEKQVLRACGSYDAGQPHRATSAGQQAVVGMGIADLCAASGKHQVAAEHQLEATGQGQSIERGDHRLGEAVQPVHRGQDAVEKQTRAVRSRLRSDVLEIGPGAEGPACAGEDDRPHVLVPLGVVQGLIDAAEHLRREGVHCLRPIQADPHGTFSNIHDNSEWWRLFSFHGLIFHEQILRFNRGIGCWGFPLLQSRLIYFTVKMNQPEEHHEPSDCIAWISAEAGQGR